MRLLVGRARLQCAPGSIARYRQRAAECRVAGERSPTPEERLLWLKLADDWLDLIGEVAERAEHWSNLSTPPQPALVQPEPTLPGVNGAAIPRNVRRWPDRSVRVLRGNKAA